MTAVEKRRETVEGCWIPLEKTTSKSGNCGVLRRLKYFLHRPSVRLGSLGRKPRSGAQLRNERFVSYLSSNNRKRIDTDLQDALLAGRKVARRLVMLAAFAMVAWVVLESARAIGMF